MLLWSDLLYLVYCSIGLFWVKPYLNRFYQLPLILKALLPDKRCLSHSMCLYQIMMMLHFFNDVANDPESTQKSKITS